MKLKKWVKWTGGIVLATGIMTFGAIQTVNWIDGNATKYEEDHQDEYYEGTDDLEQSLIDAGKTADASATAEETENETAGIDDVEGSELVDQWVDGQWWNEIDVQETIHKMSHQKVIASMKRGSIQITKQRIDNLSKAIEGNKDHLEHYGVYRAIVDRWMKGDFHQADQDHNDVWTLMDGEIGQATGVASADQEKEYIQNTFGDGE